MLSIPHFIVLSNIFTHSIYFVITVILIILYTLFIIYGIEFRLHNCICCHNAKIHAIFHINARSNSDHTLISVTRLSCDLKHQTYYPELSHLPISLIYLEINPNLCPTSCIRVFDAQLSWQNGIVMSITQAEIYESVIR